MLADGGERGAEIDRGRGLADPALLVGNPQHPRARGIGLGGRLAERDDLRIGGGSGVGVSVMVGIPSVGRLASQDRP